MKMILVHGAKVSVRHGLAPLQYLYECESECTVRAERAVVIARESCRQGGSKELERPVNMLMVRARKVCE